MNGYPRDMFGGMDEIFERVFCRMQEDAVVSHLPVSGYRIFVQSVELPEDHLIGTTVRPSLKTFPGPEIHRIDNEVKVITELPGAAPESICLDLQKNQLIIDAEGPYEPYHTTATLPPVDEGSMQKSFRNSVLEVTFRLLPDQAASA